MSEVRNAQRGAPSKAFPGQVKLPVVQRQACGHVFNSAGSPACIFCLYEKWAARLSPRKRRAA